jgi:hypothetical protein
MKFNLNLKILNIINIKTKKNLNLNLWKTIRQK